MTNPTRSLTSQVRTLVRWLVLPALVIAVSTAAPAYQVLTTQPPPPLPAGTHAWNFTTHTLSGQRLTLRSLRGHVTVIDFWATWCPPCRMAIPGLEQIYKQYRGRGVRMVGISMDTDTIKLVRPFALHEHMTYTVAADAARNPVAQAHYNALDLPSLFVVDKKGVVRWSCTGFYYGQDHDIRVQLDKLLAEKG